MAPCSDKEDADYPKLNSELMFVPRREPVLFLAAALSGMLLPADASAASGLLLGLAIEPGSSTIKAERIWSLEAFGSQEWLTQTGEWELRIPFRWIRLSSTEASLSSNVWAVGATGRWTPLRIWPAIPIVGAGILWPLDSAPGKLHGLPVEGILGVELLVHSNADKPEDSGDIHLRIEYRPTRVSVDLRSAEVLSLPRNFIFADLVWTSL